MPTNLPIDDMFECSLDTALQARAGHGRRVMLPWDAYAYTHGAAAEQDQPADIAPPSMRWSVKRRQLKGGAFVWRAIRWRGTARQERNRQFTPETCQRVYDEQVAWATAAG